LNFIVNTTVDQGDSVCTPSEQGCCNAAEVSEESGITEPCLPVVSHIIGNHDINDSREDTVGGGDDDPTGSRADDCIMAEQSRAAVDESSHDDNDGDANVDDVDSESAVSLSADDALRSMTKVDVTEMKSYARPNRRVQKVGEAVCLLLGKAPTWTEFKKLTQNGNVRSFLKVLSSCDLLICGWFDDLTAPMFLEKLMAFDKESVPRSTLSKVIIYSTNSP
jgi:hypothetical protein